MAINKKTFSTGLSGKEQIYCNDFYQYKGEYNIFTDSFSYQSTEALRDLNDVKTNNYSNLFLGKKQYIADWLEVNEKPKQELNRVSTLSFKKSKKDDPDDLGIWLYFGKNYTFFDNNLDQADYFLSWGLPEGDQIYSYFFYIEYVSETQCRISHTFGEITYYLSVDEKNTISFVRDCKNNSCIFFFTIEENMMRLYKKVDTYDPATKKTTSAMYTLGWKEDKEGNYVFDLIPGYDQTEKSLIYINEIQTQLAYYLNNSWIGYDQHTAIAAINLDKSAFYLKSQALFHHQYNKDDGMNFVPLKNNVTYTNAYTRGDNMTFSYLEYPDVNFRDYTSIHSGLNQEYGNDNIILNFYFADQVFTLHDGETIEWHIPSIEENNGKNPIYPYTKMNIADSKFVKNGAFASDVPYFADKVYKMQGTYTILKNASGKRLSPNNGVYLCTWLYQYSTNNDAIWLDRYYYPDKISRKQALTAAHFSESFDNMIDLNYNSTQVQNLIKESTYFDKRSDFVFEPNNDYKFSHISSAVVNEVMERMKNDTIHDVEDKHGNLAYLSDKMELDGRTFLRIDNTLFNKTNAINFNTDIYIPENKKIGLQLFGSDYTHGFNIQNRKDLAPYHYYATEKIVYLMNNEFAIRHSFDLFTKYNEKIVKLIMGDIFDDLFVVAENCLYILTYDLSLKARVNYADIAGVTELKLPVAVGKMLADGNAILYNNNILLPYEQQLYKIIFVPDSDKDKFTEEEATKNPCKMRKLDHTEYYVNYQKTTDANGKTQEPGLENSFIEVDNKFKNVFVNDYGKIFVFNFDKIAASPDKDTIYGLYAKDTYIAAGGWYWLYNQSMSRMQAEITSSKFTEFGSEESIDFIKINDLAMMCLVRGFANKSTNRRLEVYDETKQRFFQWPLDGYDEIYSLDAYRYIDADWKEHSVFVVFGKLANLDQMSRVMYQADTGKVFEDEVDVPVAKLPKFRETTNSNVLMRYYGENKLYFNLYFPNTYLQNYHESIVWDLQDIQEGWYNINVHINLDTSQFEVKINDLDFDNRNESKAFKPYVNSNSTIFDMTYYVGALAKRYGTTMHRILYDDVEDRYACRNSRIENMIIVCKDLAYHEYQAIRMNGRKINPITITIPIGQHNNIEEIVRYFKYVPPTAISNKVKINISGTGLTTRGEFELLEAAIRRELQNNKDCLVDVESIEFI